MEEGPACVELHLVHLAYEPEVNHCAHPFACDHLGITASRVDGLKLAERRTHCRPNQEGKFFCSPNNARAFSRFASKSKSQGLPSSWFMAMSSDAPGKILKEGRSFAAAATLGGL